MDENIELCKDYTIKKYNRDCSTQNKGNIAKFINKRFKERYIDAVKGPYKHGFTIMAISCLMIEAIETFENGERNSKDKSKQFFIDFFKRCFQLKEFKDEEISKDFYYGIRCGIFHQAETTNGWKITRMGDLYDSETKTINATKFLKILEEYLQDYAERLKKAEWNDDIWVNFRIKMDAIIENCKIRDYNTD